MRFLILLCALLVAGCDDSVAPRTPSPLEGVWTYSTSQWGGLENCSIQDGRLEIAHDGTRLTGQLASTMACTAADYPWGPWSLVSAAVSGDAVEIRLDAGQEFSHTGVLEGDRITGTFELHDLDNTYTGTFTAIRQQP